MTSVSANKSLQSDNLRGVACVHTRCAPICSTQAPPHKFRLSEALGLKRCSVRIIFVEGMPGCGKSTLSDKLSAMIREKGHDSFSHQELDKTHPVYVLRDKEKDIDSVQYLNNYLDAWGSFAKSYSHENEIHIFDATPFQSFIRFAIEAGNSERCSGYLSKLENTLSGISSSIIYLRPECPMKQTDYCILKRGEAWGSKVSSYVESTHLSRKYGWIGVAGMRCFWEHYVLICDSLLSEIKMPKKVIRTVPGEWGRVQEEAFSFVDKQIA